MEGFKKKKRLGDMLIEEQVITPEQFERAMEERGKTGKKTGEVIVELGFATEETVAEALARQLRVEMVNPNTIDIPSEALSMLTGQMLRKYMAIPIGFDPNDINVLRVAMADPMDIMAIDDLSIVTNMQIDACIATSRNIAVALDKHYGNAEAMDVAEKYAKEREEKFGDGEDEKEDEIDNSPIVVLVKQMIEQAARLRTSDIHVEALENKTRVRYRIDGALYEQISYDASLHSAIIARLKVIGGMDISEKRKPQDGRITMVVDQQEYDIRVSILPTVYGEKCVMRLAQKTALSRNKADLGFTEKEMKRFDHILSNPNGIILVTGPTGSGKSTTLYTALSELNKEDVNIITVEDPVEANVNGINQVHVNAKAGLTFASALRSILRQDPDIIMIGEIRDQETASIAVQAAITGHLVVSTLHTNSAANTIGRLLDMGVESYMVADAVVGVLAQRLVRRLCPHCKQGREATVKEKELLNVPVDEPLTIYEPVGCAECNDAGYRGRIGVYELMEVTPELKRIIARDGSAEEIKNQALKDGMSTLRMSAGALVVRGITSMNEMMKVSFDS